MDDAVDQLFHDTILAAAAPRGAAEPHWAQCSVPGCLALVPETPRSGNRLAHIAWVTRVCADHLRHGDVHLRDEEPQRLCWKCHRLQPVTAFEGARRTCIQRMLQHNQRRRMKRKAATLQRGNAPTAPAAGAPT